MFVCGLTSLINWKLDNDAWFILNCGRYIVETGTIPHTEFATIHEGLDYVMEQWLTAVIFWKIFSNYGADGLIFFSWLIGFTLIFVYYKLCLFVSNGNKKVSAMLTLIIGIFATIPFFVTRPQIFSTLIFLIEIFLLERFVSDKKSLPLFTLPLLAVVLVNLHAALFPMMIVLLLPYITESLYRKIKPARETETPLLPLILAAVGIFFEGFLNPYGWEGMTFVFTSYDPEIHGAISEVQPPTVKHVLGLALFGFSALLIIAHCKKEMPLRYSFLSFGIAILAFQSIRSVFLFLILATFPLAFAAKDWHPFDKIFNLPHKLFLPLFLICIPEIYKIYSFSKISIWEIRLPMKIIFALSIIFLACFIFFYRKEGKLFSEEIFILRRKPLIALATFQLIIFLSLVGLSTPAPKYEVYKPALDFLLSKNRAEDIILWTGFNNGAYAEFRGVKTYFDARPEIFALSNNHKKEIAREYFSLTNGVLDHEEFFERYNFTHIFVTDSDIVLYALLTKDKNYKLMFEYDFPDGKGHGKIFKPVKK